MAETVKIPGMGDVDKRWVIGAGFLLGGAVVWAYWRSSKASVEPPATEGDVTADDLAYSPDAFAGAIPGGSTVTDATPTAATNSDWSQRAVELLQAMGWEANFISTAIGKYLSGQPLTASEATLIRSAWALLGKPPQTPDLPIIEQTTAAPTPVGNHHYVAELHKIAAPESARNLVRRFSDASVATGNNIQTGLLRTTADPRNARYMKYYASHHGTFPAQAGVYVTVVKANAAAA